MNFNECRGSARTLCGMCGNPSCGVDPVFIGFAEVLFWTWGLLFAFLWVGAFTHFMACRSFAYSPQSKEKLKAWHAATRNNANNVKICIWIPCFCICIWGWCWAHIFLNLTMLSAHLYTFCVWVVSKPVQRGAAWCRRLDAVRTAPMNKKQKAKIQWKKAAESAAELAEEAKGVDVEVPNVDLDIDLDLDFEFELDIPRYPLCSFLCNLGRIACGCGIGDFLRLVVGFWFRLLYACASISIVWFSLFNLDLTFLSLPDLQLPHIQFNLGIWGFWHKLTIPFITLDLFDWSVGAHGCLALEVLLKNSMMCFVIGVVAIVAGTHLTTLFGTRMKAFARMYPQIPFVDQICGVLPKASGYALKSSVTAVSATAVFMLSNFFNFNLFYDQCGVGWIPALAAAAGIGAAFTVLNWMSMWIYAGGLNKYDDAVRLVTGGIDPRDSEAMNAYLQKAVSSTCNLITTFFHGYIAAAMRGFYHTFLLMIGVWPKSMIEHLGLARIGAQNDPEPYNPNVTPFRAIIRLEAASMGLLWYMVPGCQILGEYIQQANDPPIYIAPGCGVKLHGSPKILKAKYWCNMTQVTCQIAVAFTANAFFMWIVAAMCFVIAILDLAAISPALANLLGETLEAARETASEVGSSVRSKREEAREALMRGFDADAAHLGTDMDEPSPAAPAQYVPPQLPAGSNASAAAAKEV